MTPFEVGAVFWSVLGIVGLGAPLAAAAARRFACAFGLAEAGSCA